MSAINSNFTVTHAGQRTKTDVSSDGSNSVKPKEQRQIQKAEYNFRRDAAGAIAVFAAFVSILALYNWYTMRNFTNELKAHVDMRSRQITALF
jgi:hypothetical protein